MEKQLTYLHKLIHEFSGKHKHVDNVMLGKFFDNVSNSLESVIDDHRTSDGKRPNPEDFRKVFSDLCNTVESLKANNSFTKQLSIKFFDILFDPELQSWILKEILKVYLRIVKKSDRSIRVSFTEETGFNYLGRLMELIFCADYEFQNMIVETIFRMSDHKLLGQLKDIFCYDEEEKKAFFSITLENFHKGSRRYLNIVNRKGNIVLSVLCYKVSFDVFDLQAPPELQEYRGLWIDVNCKGRTITFFIDNTPFSDSSTRDSWEMVTILPETISDAQISYASGKEPGKTIAIGKIMLKKSVLLTASSHILQDCKTLVLYSSDVGKLQRIFQKVIPSMCRRDFMRKKTHFSNKVYRPLKMGIFRSSSLSRASSNASSIVERPYLGKNRKYTSDILHDTSASSSSSLITLKRNGTDKYHLYSLDDAESNLENSTPASAGITAENPRQSHCGLSLDTWMTTEQNKKKNTKPVEETQNSSKDSRKILLELMHERHTSVQRVQYSSSLLEELINEPIQPAISKNQPKMHVIKELDICNSSEISGDKSLVEMNSSSLDSVELDNLHNNTHHRKRSERQFDGISASRSSSSDFLLVNRTKGFASTDNPLQNVPAEKNAFLETLRSCGLAEEEQDVVPDPFDALLKEKPTRNATNRAESGIEISREPNFIKTSKPAPSKENVSSSYMTNSNAGSQQPPISASTDDQLQNIPAEENVFLETMRSCGLAEDEQDIVCDPFDALLREKPTRNASIRVESGIEISNEPNFIMTSEPANANAGFQQPRVRETATETEIFETAETHVSVSAENSPESERPQFQDIPDVNLLSENRSDESESRAHLRSRAKVLIKSTPTLNVDKYKFNVELTTLKESRLLKKACESLSQIADSPQSNEPQALVVRSPLHGLESQNTDTNIELDQECRTDPKDVEKSLMKLFKGLNTPPEQSSGKAQKPNSSSVLLEHGTLSSTNNANCNNPQLLEYAEHLQLLAVLDSQEKGPDNTEKANDNNAENDIIQNADQHSSNVSLSETNVDDLPSQAEKILGKPERSVKDKTIVCVCKGNIDSQRSLQMEIPDVQENDKEEQSLRNTAPYIGDTQIETHQMRDKPDELQPVEKEQLKTRDIEGKKSESRKRCSEEAVVNKPKKRILDIIEEDPTNETKKLKKRKTQDDSHDRKYNSLKKREARREEQDKYSLTLKRNPSNISSKSSKRRLYDPTILPDIPSTSFDRTAKTPKRRKLARSEKKRLLSVLDEFLDEMSKMKTLNEPRVPPPRPKVDTQKKCWPALDFTKYDLKQKVKRKLEVFHSNRGTTTSTHNPNDRIIKEFFESVDKFRKDFKAGLIGKPNAAAKKKLLEGAEFLIDLI